MNHRFIKSTLFAAAGLIATFLVQIPVAAQKAEVKEVRIARQYGLGYLPLIILEDQKLIEKHANAVGLGGLKVTWATVGGGGAANDALLSGSIDYIATGVAPLVLLWAKSNGEVKSVSALNNSPIYINTTNPAVKTIRDLSEKDRIALPTVKVSIQAIFLQMAVADVFGSEQYTKLDNYTVSMKHPDGVAALLSERSEVTTHVTGPPFSYVELRDSRVRKITDSYELLGGPHTLLLLSSTVTFQQKNPRIFGAVFAALEEAFAFIKANPDVAADIYLRASESKETKESILEQLEDPQITFSATPEKIKAFADFMYSTGSIKKKAASWKELFFDTVHKTPGN